MRSAIWSDRQLQHSQWVTDVDFRANGPERGGGNLNIWLVHDGAHDVGSKSIYTVGKFEGLALVVDQHGGTGGVVRGFLNDGTTDYSSAQVDALSFGHCNYAYRNLGRPSQIKLRQTESAFRVEVDGKLCFESDKIRIPTGYNFGITAASADNPDSFEVFKLTVLADSLGAQQDQPVGQQQMQQDQQQQAAPDRPSARFGRAGRLVDQPGEDGYEGDIPDEDADRITSSKAQFTDLHNRLQSVNHHLSTIFRQVSQQGTIGEKRHEETSVMLGEIKGLLSKLDRIADLEQKVVNLEREMRALRGDVAQKVRDSENAIKGHIIDTHATLQDTVKSSAPGHGRLIFIILGSQVLLVAAYIFYKRRKNSSPKKYL